MSTINTRFLVLSDTHDFQFTDETAAHDFRVGLPKIDVLLHCGDLTQVGGVPSFKKALRMLASVDAELKLVIAGNHDLELDKEFWSTHLDEGDEIEEHDEALAVWTGDEAKQAGSVYLQESTHEFALKNGATLRVYASPYTPEFGDWAFPYPRDIDRYDVPSGVDIMMTHGPPRGFRDECPDGHQGCDNLLRAVSDAKPLLHCFGHIHEGYGAEVVTWSSDSPVRRTIEGQASNNRQRHICAEQSDLEAGKSTLMVNAAIMTDSYRPENLPWVIDLPMPATKQ